MAPPRVFSSVPFPSLGRPSPPPLEWTRHPIHPPAPSIQSPPPSYSATKYIHFLRVTHPHPIWCVFDDETSVCTITEWGLLCSHSLSFTEARESAGAPFTFEADKTVGTPRERRVDLQCVLSDGISSSNVAVIGKGKGLIAGGSANCSIQLISAQTFRFGKYASRFPFSFSLFVFPFCLTFLFSVKRSLLSFPSFC